MPLSPPAARQDIHTRRIECRGYRRADGLWDVEGRLTDVKAYAFHNDHRGTLQPGDPLHDMWLRLTLDDTFTIVAIEAVTDRAPYHLCGDIAPAFGKLVGLKLTAGFKRQVKTLLGGTHGCTHLTELLGPVATTAFQTIYPILARERGMRVEHTGESPNRPPPLLNTCHAFASDGELVRKLWPDSYTGGPSAEKRRRQA